MFFSQVGITIPEIWHVARASKVSLLRYVHTITVKSGLEAEGFYLLPDFSNRPIGPRIIFHL